MGFQAGAGALQGGLSPGQPVIHEPIMKVCGNPDQFRVRSWASNQDGDDRGAQDEARCCLEAQVLCGDVRIFDGPKVIDQGKAQSPWNSPSTLVPSHRRKDRRGSCPAEEDAA